MQPLQLHFSIMMVDTTVRILPLVAILTIVSLVESSSQVETKESSTRHKSIFIIFLHSLNDFLLHFSQEFSHFSTLSHLIICKLKNVLKLTILGVQRLTSENSRSLFNLGCVKVQTKGHWMLEHVSLPKNVEIKAAPQ